KPAESVQASREVLREYRVGSSTVEQRPFKSLVLGSNPSQPTIFNAKHAPTRNNRGSDRHPRDAGGAPRAGQELQARGPVRRRPGGPSDVPGPEARRRDPRR